MSNRATHEGKARIRAIAAGLDAAAFLPDETGRAAESGLADRPILFKSEVSPYFLRCCQLEAGFHCLPAAYCGAPI